jgi:hypothetical protein
VRDGSRFVEYFLRDGLHPRAHRVVAVAFEKRVEVFDAPPGELRITMRDLREEGEGVACGAPSVVATGVKAETARPHSTRKATAAAQAART